jgi:hypothetical protein
MTPAVFTDLSAVAGECSKELAALLVLPVEGEPFRLLLTIKKEAVPDLVSRLSLADDPAMELVRALVSEVIRVELED